MVRLVVAGLARVAADFDLTRYADVGKVYVFEKAPAWVDYRGVATGRLG